MNVSEVIERLARGERPMVRAHIADLLIRLIDGQVGLKGYDADQDAAIEAICNAGHAGLDVAVEADEDGAYAVRTLYPRGRYSAGLDLEPDHLCEGCGEIRVEHEKECE